MDGGIKSFQDLAARVGDILRDLISDMAAEWAKSKIFTPMANSITGAGGGSGIGGMIGGIGSSFMGGMSGVGDAFTSGGFSGAMGGLTTALGGATSSMAGLATAAGAIAAPVLAVAAVLSFLKSTTTEVAAGLKITTDAMGTLVQAFSSTETKRFWGMSRSSNTTVENAARSVADPIETAVMDMQTQIVGMADTLGIGARAFKDFTYSFKIDTKGLTDEQITQELQKQFGLMGDAMSGLVPGIARVAQTGETATETLTRLAGALAGVNAIQESAGLGGFDASLRGAARASDLADLVGGLDALASATQTFVSEFYSEARQLELTTGTLRGAVRDVRRDFDSLSGVQFPKTRDAYVDLIEGLNLNTQAGRAMYAVLIGNASAFDSIYDEAEAAGEGVGNLADALAAFAQTMGDALTNLANSEMATPAILEDWFKYQKDQIIENYREQRRLAIAAGASADDLALLRLALRDLPLSELRAEFDDLTEGLTAAAEAAAAAFASTMGDALTALANSDKATPAILSRWFDYQKDQIEKNYREQRRLAVAAGASQADLILLRMALLDLPLAELNKEFADLTSGVTGFLDEIAKLEGERSDIIAELTSRSQALAAAEKSLLEARNSINASDAAPGNELTQLAELQRQFRAAETAVRGGDLSAVSTATSLAQQVLAQGQLVYGSSTDYASLFTNVNTVLSSLQSLVSSQGDRIDSVLSADRFEDITQRTTNQLLRGLASIDARLERLNALQEAAERRATANTQRNSTGKAA
jgi:hypothetical protein